MEPVTDAWPDLLICIRIISTGKGRSAISTWPSEPDMSPGLKVPKGRSADITSIRGGFSFTNPPKYAIIPRIALINPLKGVKKERNHHEQDRISRCNSKEG